MYLIFYLFIFVQTIKITTSKLILNAKLANYVTYS